MCGSSIAAGLAPGAPKIQQHDPSAEVGQAHGPGVAGQRLQAEFIQHGPRLGAAAGRPPAGKSNPNRPVNPACKTKKFGQQNRPGTERLHNACLGPRKGDA